MKILFMILCTSLQLKVVLANNTYPKSWNSIILNAFSSKTKSNYNLELIEFHKKDNSLFSANSPILLMIPGYFQNAYSWDLLPESGISLVDYIYSKYSLQIYSLQPNGIGKSQYIKKSDLDDIAIDDIGTAVQFIKEKFPDRKIFLFGHSNGAISLQAYLGGLSRSQKGNYFDVSMARSRQEGITGVGLSAGNVCMTDSDKNTQLDKMSKLGIKIEFILKKANWIDSNFLTKVISPTKGKFGQYSLAYAKFWEFLYHRENTTKEAQAALYNRTLEGTSAATLIQYSRGVVSGCIVNSIGEDYNWGLLNIKLPIFQMTYEHDPMAVPYYTWRDSFNVIASPQKEFVTFDDQGHEDYMMNKKLHKNFDWLMARLNNL